MDRFEQGLPDPQEMKVVGHCDECGGEIYEGQTVISFGADRLCNSDCLINYLGAVTISAGEDEQL